MPHCEPQEDSDSDGNYQSHQTSVLSIIHGIMYSPSDGVKWMPKHIAVGSILRQATRSTLLVDLLHKAGHYSYDRQILKVDTSLAQGTDSVLE